MTAPTNEQLRELLAKATQGEWRVVDCNERGDAVCESSGYNDYDDEAKYIEAADVRVAHRVPNMRLIVAAVNALPRLLDEVEHAPKSASLAESMWHEVEGAVHAGLGGEPEPRGMTESGLNTYIGIRKMLDEVERLRFSHSEAVVAEAERDEWMGRALVAEKENERLRVAWMALRANMHISEGSNDPLSARGVWFKGEDAVAQVQAMDAAAKAAS